MRLYVALRRYELFFSITARLVFVARAVSCHRCCCVLMVYVPVMTRRPSSLAFRFSSSLTKIVFPMVFIVRERLWTRSLVLRSTKNLLISASSDGDCAVLLLGNRSGESRSIIRSRIALQVSVLIMRKGIMIPREMSFIPPSSACV